MGFDPLMRNKTTNQPAKNIMKTLFTLLIAALTLASTAKAQVEITPTSLNLGGAETADKTWGACVDAFNHTISLVKMEQNGNAMHFTVWNRLLTGTKEFTISHERLANGKNLIQFNCRAEQSHTIYTVSKNLFSFDDEFVVAVYLADGSGVLINDKNEIIGNIPADVLDSGSWSTSINFIYLDGVPYLQGEGHSEYVEDKGWVDTNPIYSISCWADGKQAMHKQADLTNDGQVDVTDVAKMIDIVLGRE